MVNEEKTKVVETIKSEDQNCSIENYVFEKTQSFKYLGATITGNWSTERSNRMNKGERAYFALIKNFKSKLFSRYTKIRLYMAIVRPTVLYGCEIWPLTARVE